MHPHSSHAAFFWGFFCAIFPEAAAYAVFWAAGRTFVSVEECLAVACVGTAAAAVGFAIAIARATRPARRQHLAVGDAVPWESHTWRVSGLSEAAFSLLPDKAVLTSPPFELADRTWVLRLFPEREPDGPQTLVVELSFADLRGGRRVHQHSRLVSVNMVVNGRHVPDMLPPSVWAADDPKLQYLVPAKDEFPMPRDELVVSVAVRPFVALV